jgi:methionine--tRNA ligase beta chain
MSDEVDQVIISFDEFIKVDIQVAQVIEAIAHPNADKLMVLKVKLHDCERQIVAGIRLHYTPESLVGKQILVVANLEPRKLRGVESHGMVLAAFDGNGGLALMVPDKFVEPGTRVG